MKLKQLEEDLALSMKAGKTERVETLRFLISAVRNAAAAKYANAWEASMTEEDVADGVKKQIKTHKESIEAFEKAGRNDLVAREKGQLDILMEFAPKELTDDELKALLAPIAKNGEKPQPAGRQDFGLLMKQAMEKVRGQADGGRVAAALKNLLQ